MLWGCGPGFGLSVTQNYWDSSSRRELGCIHWQQLLQTGNSLWGVCGSGVCVPCSGRGRAELLTAGSGAQLAFCCSVEFTPPLGGGHFRISIIGLLLLYTAA